MATIKKFTGTVIATAAAAVFSGCVSHSDTRLAANSQEAKIKCQGINSCNGTSDCRSATSSCAGRNHCAGDGWLFVESVQACKSKGGSILES